MALSRTTRFLSNKFYCTTSMPISGNSFEQNVWLICLYFWFNLIWFFHLFSHISVIFFVLIGQKSGLSQVPRYLFNQNHQIWWENSKNNQLYLMRPLSWFRHPTFKIKIFVPWLLPWIPQWLFPYYGFCHAIQPLRILWVLPCIPLWVFPFHEFCNNIQTALVPCVFSCYPTIGCTV